MKFIADGITGKKVLEVACGCAEFSIEASNIADEIQCIDIDKSRLSSEIENHSNIMEV